MKVSVWYKWKIWEDGEGRKITEINRERQVFFLSKLELDYIEAFCSTVYPFA